MHDLWSFKTRVQDNQTGSSSTIKIHLWDKSQYLMFQLEIAIESTLNATDNCFTLIVIRDC